MLTANISKLENQFYFTVLVARVLLLVLSTVAPYSTREKLFRDLESAATALLWLFNAAIAAAFFDTSRIRPVLPMMRGWRGRSGALRGALGGGVLAKHKKESNINNLAQLSHI